MTTLNWTRSLIPTAVNSAGRMIRTETELALWCNGRRRNGGDTQSRNLYEKLVQVDLYKKLDLLTWFLVQYFSCTRFLHRIQHSSIPYKKLACTWLEWWAMIGRLPIAAMFSFCCVDVVDNLLHKVNTVCLLIYFVIFWNLCKFLAQVSWLCVTTIREPGTDSEWKWW